MNYAVAFTPEAPTNLLAMPPEVASFVLDQIEWFAADPVQRGNPGKAAFESEQVLEFGVRINPDSLSVFSILRTR